ncbi:hypothetical protein BDFB_015217 [Asbolus verrucosus]|uniref:Uncharacterized protein n=1 Tax=Asbolus verrucosus TaxID=1661398 RepID=A0A482W1T3_ASBVE|nr:hypothetical protein BDFB_015217 [Asbolus verrucosus]
MENIKITKRSVR